MRKAWSRHPIKNQFKLSVRVKAPMGLKIDKKTGLPKMVWCHVCMHCGETYRDADVQVDHILPAGAFSDWDDCQAWLMGLMQITFESLQMLCVSCHEVKSYADQYGYTLDEAVARKSYIAWNRDTDVNEQKELLIDAGYTDVSNEPKRKAAYLHLYDITYKD